MWTRAIELMNDEKRIIRRTVADGKDNLDALESDWLAVAVWVFNE
jgi:hypothetical protein